MGVIINKPSLTENQLAERWNITTKTLQHWRKVGKGPHYLKIGKSVRYPHELIEKYEAEHLTASTSSTEA
jgi:predicted site-specific integrase-resolvase